MEQPFYDLGIELQRVSFDEFFHNLIYGVQRQLVKAEEGTDFRSAKRKRFSANQRTYKRYNQFENLCGMGYQLGKWCRIYEVVAVKRNKGDFEIHSKEEGESGIDYVRTGQIGREK